MAAIFQIRRGTTDISSSIVDGELYLHKGKNSLQVAIGDGNPITLLALNTASFGDIILTGSAYISGNVVLGGTITIGDSTSDSVIFNADLSSSIIPDATNTYDLGSTSKVYRAIYGTNIYGAIAATNGVVSGSSQILGGTGIVSGSSQITYTNISSIPSGIFSGSSQVDADSITNFDSNVKDKLNTDGVISGSSQITPLLPNGVVSGSSQISLGSVTGNSTTNVTEGTNLYYTDARVKTKLNAETVVSGSSQITLSSVTGYGTVINQNLLTTSDVTHNNLTLAGNLIVNGTTTTINSTTVQIGDNIIELNGTGIANGGLLVKDPTGGSTLSGSLLWDSTNDYWKGGTLSNESKLLRAGGDSVISGSSQVLGGTGIVSGSSQITPLLPTGTVSGSTQIANLGYATTGSNSFYGNQIISGNIYLTGSIIPSGSAIFDLGSDTHPFQHLYVGSGSIYLGGTRIFGTETIVPQIGEEIEGGIVFYIAQDQSYVLIVDKNDTGITNSFEKVSAASGSAIGTGESNTNAIVAVTGLAQNPARICYDYNGGGYTDWYLPSINELYEAKIALNLIPDGVFYWSSTTGSSAPYEAAASQNNYLTTPGTYIYLINRTTVDKQPTVGQTSIEGTVFSTNHLGPRVRAIRKSATRKSTLQTLTNQTISGSITLSGLVNGVDISASYVNTNNRLNVLETTYVTTSSLNLYTASANAWSGTIDTRFTTLGSYTGSLNSFTTSTSQSLLQLYSSSTNHEERIDYIEGIGGISGGSPLAPLNIFSASINTFTSSTNTRLNNIEAATSSYETTGRSIVSSSAQIVPLLPAGVVSGSSQVITSNAITLGTHTTGNYVATIAGTTNQITVAGSGLETAAITLSTPQDIHTSANVQFNSIGVGTAATAVTGEIRAMNDITAFYSSDIRLKENIFPIRNALQKVNEISGNTYDWKEGFEEIHSHKGNDVGVIAQEIEIILPEIVTNRDNGFKAVQYEKIIPLLIEAIKELSAKVKELENK